MQRTKLFTHICTMDASTFGSCSLNDKRAYGYGRTFKLQYSLITDLSVSDGTQIKGLCITLDQIMGPRLEGLLQISKSNEFISRRGVH